MTELEIERTCKLSISSQVLYPNHFKGDTKRLEQSKDTAH